MTLLAERGRRLLLFVLGVLALVGATLAVTFVVGGRCGGISGCDPNGLPLGPVTVRDLEAHPESTLYYVGATLITHGGIAQQSTPKGRGSAYTTSILATHDAADRVYGWYDAWLTAHGWRSVEMLQSTAELSVRGWMRGSREVTIVSILDPVRWQNTFGDRIPSSQTIVRTRYGIYPVGG